MSSSDDWTLSSDWLERCGMLTEEQNYSLASVEHLASILKDGVILCNLCNRLKPNAILSKNFSIRPQSSPFLCGKNIRAFLNSCKSSFHMKESDLFQPADLLEFQDFGKVICTLSKLSKTSEAKKCKIEPFNADEGMDYVIMQKVIDEVEDEYNSSYYGTKSDNIGTDDFSEEIYDILITSKVEENLSKVVKPKKELCINELVMTEMNFVEVLHTIFKVFMRKMRDYLSSQEYSTIFFLIDDLRRIHGDIYKKLVVAESSRQPAVEIAKCFVENYTSFVVYGEFCSMIEASIQELVRVCQANPKVAKIVEDGFKTSKVKLHDLLIVPIQRILKYHLIIRELIKHCQGNQQEVAELKKALEVMEDLGMYINEVKRDNENIRTISEIQKSIVDIQKYFAEGSSLSLESFGRRHFDGEFYVVKRQCKLQQNVKRVFKPIPTKYIFLFDKLIIICSIKRKGELYNYKASLALRTLDVQSGAGVKGLSYLVLSNVEKPDEKFFVSEKRPESILKLSNYLDLAMSNCCPLDRNAGVDGRYTFLLSSFSEASWCCVCHKLLRGKISQGYKCQNTDKIVHKECLSKVVEQSVPAKPPASRSRPPVPKPRTEVVASNDSSSRKNSRKTQGLRLSNFQDQPWFSAMRTRTCATRLLSDLPSGTFLVRWSEEKKSYVVSLKYQSVRHMVIKKSDSGEFYFKASQSFKSVPLLIDCYKRNSLQEVFGIACALDVPYTQATRLAPKRCRAIYDFSATEAGQLTFRAGDIMEVLSDSGYGWLRGSLKGVKGNIPSNHVEIIEEDQ